MINVYELTWEALRGRGGFIADLVIFLGGSSGGSSSKLLSEALLTVTKLEEDVRESLLETMLLCFDGDTCDVIPSLKSSVEADPLL